MIFVGIDDTDTKESPGTNQVARSIIAELGLGFHCLRIVRHQLLVDPRVPYTSKNSCCSLLIQPPSAGESVLETLRAGLRELLLARFQPGSDPGLCLTVDVPGEVVEFGRRCQQEVTRQAEARDIASRHNIPLEGLGGTEDGVIGALAAIGLAATENDGRIVQIRQQPDDLCGWQSVADLHRCGIDQITCRDEPVTSGRVDIGKHLRPNLRQGRIVLFVQPHDSDSRAWQAVREL